MCLISGRDIGANEEECIAYAVGGVAGSRAGEENVDVDVLSVDACMLTALTEVNRCRLDGMLCISCVSFFPPMYR